MVSNDRIYLAAPYTLYNDKDDLVQRVTTLAAKIYYHGFIVFSPLTMTHPICKVGLLPEDYSYWNRLDESIIELWATQYWLAAFEGWTQSNGCYREALCAFNKNIPCSIIGTSFEFLAPLNLNKLSAE